MTEPPLTLRQLQREMRLAGWERLPGPGSAYQHKVTGKVINLLKWRVGIAFEDKGVLMEISGGLEHEWQRWAAARETPPPF